MTRLQILIAVCLALSAQAVSSEPDAAPIPEAAAAVDFVRDVRPIFAAHCFECHGPEAREGGLRLDYSRAALAGSDSGRVIVPGKPDESLLIQYVSGQGETVMPPESEGLPAEAVAVLRQWITDGAVWPASADPDTSLSDHWAFQPLAVTEPPVSHAALHPVDAFVRARLEAAGITPSPRADRTMLIKRLYYDLLGLPPEPEAVDRFVNSTSPQAYAELVEELLASPHFGERWGRHWLDVARYADSDGYEKDNPRYNAWKYRDWVIQAVNDDLPFDRFTIEQLAGDLLPKPQPEQLVATGFNRQTLTNTEGGTDQEQFRVEAVFDRVETLGTAWLGLTVGCARCHSHKYDPITQREYYQLFAFFNNGDEASTTVATSEHALQQYLVSKAAYDAQLSEARRQAGERKAALAPQLPQWEQEQRAQLGDRLNQPAALHDLELISAAAHGAATIERQDDGSLLVSGERPATDEYELQFWLPHSGVTAFRLDALADERLPGKGPGRADSGNFVLSELLILLTDPHGDGEGVVLSCAKSTADFSQPEFEVAHACDQLQDEKGWGVKTQTGKDHFATFYLSDGSRNLLETEPRPLRLRVRLVHKHEKSPHHTLGRFRLRAVTGYDGESLGLPESVLQILKVPPEERTPEQADAILTHFAGTDATFRQLQAAVDELEKQPPFKPEMAVAVIQERQQERRVTRMFRRGEFLEPLDEVGPGAPAVLPALEPRRAEAEPDRLDLARWLVSADNPLPARVAVNHIWSHLFGRGLVRTPNDFGTRGERPTHPELLDWLAAEFQRLGWSRKALIRTIVTSETYQQTSRHRPELADVDPENRLLYRQNRFRVEAEIVRDLHLAASGLLSRQIGGPSVFPPLPPGIAELSYAGNFKWGTSDWNTRPDRPTPVPPQQDVHRRGMYTFFKRTAPHPNLTTFDCPDANLTNVQRSASNTPLQALITLNNETYVAAARGMMRRVLVEVNTNDAERVTRMFRLCAARPPEESERHAFLDVLTAAREYYRGHDAEAVAFAGVDLPPDTTSADAAAWTATARIIMNLDEFITRE